MATYDRYGNLMCSICKTRMAEGVDFTGRMTCRVCANTKKRNVKGYNYSIKNDTRWKNWR